MRTPAPVGQDADDAPLIRLTARSSPYFSYKRQEWRARRACREMLAGLSEPRGLLAVLPCQRRFWHPANASTYQAGRYLKTPQ